MPTLTTKICRECDGSYVEDIYCADGYCQHCSKKYLPIRSKKLKKKLKSLNRISIEDQIIQRKFKKNE